MEKVSILELMGKILEKELGKMGIYYNEESFCMYVFIYTFIYVIIEL